MRYPKEEIERMPVLSKFYGIVIRMAFTRAFVAHFHAIYGQSELVVGFLAYRRGRGRWWPAFWALKLLPGAPMIFQRTGVYLRS
jgi:hypothetical protein